MKTQGFTWDLVQSKQKWPWHDTLGPNMLIEVKQFGKTIMTISPSQVMCGLDLRLVEQHRKFLQQKEDKLIKSVITKLQE